MQMEPNQSVIRLMTRLAAEHGAINLAQGFTDEAPPFELAWGALTALLGGDGWRERWGRGGIRRRRLVR